MLTSLRGIYENGTVRFMEPVPATSTPIEVVVVFLEASGLAAPEATAGFSAHSLARPAAPNEHMARLRESWQRARASAAGMTGPALSEEVLADRQEDR